VHMAQTLNVVFSSAGQLAVVGVFQWLTWQKADVERTDPEQWPILQQPVESLMTVNQCFSQQALTVVMLIGLPTASAAPLDLK